MSDTKKKRRNIILIVFAVIILLTACFVSVAIYAKKEINKPLFVLPEAERQASAVKLPEDKAGVCDYAQKVYTEAVFADDSEGSWHTDVNLGGDMTLPFNSPDNEIISFIRDRSGGEISGMYEREDNVNMAKAKTRPEIKINEADVLEFTATEGHTDENGNVSDDAFYFIDLVLDPSAADVDNIKESDAYKGVSEKLAAALEIKDITATVKSYTMSFKIDRVYSQLTDASVTKTYEIKATVAPTGDYSGLLPDGQTQADVILPYETVQRIHFNHYCARFTERNIAVKVNDMKALPLNVTVNSEATKDDYKLTFDFSRDGIVEIDEDAVMTVSKASDEPVIITVNLDYDGHSYTDNLTVYITEMEVSTNVRYQ